MIGKERPQPEEPFEFTKREQLYDQLSHRRFEALLHDPQTAIHEVELSSNSYGEFMFVTISRPQGEQRSHLTFYGAGYHEYRERWITEVWSWFQTNEPREAEKARVTLETTEQMIADRLAEIRPYMDKDTQSARGRLYDFLAEIEDEDGAISDLDDLGDLADWLFGDGE